MDFENMKLDRGPIAVNDLARDVAMLSSGLVGKHPDSIDFDRVLEYLELLKAETERVKEGVYAKDNSIYYTSGGEISFDKEQITK